MVIQEEGLAPSRQVFQHAFAALVGAGALDVRSLPLARAHVVSPQIVLVTAIRFHEPVLPASVQPCHAKVRRVGHFGRPGPAAGSAPLRIGCRRTKLQPCVWPHASDQLHVWPGLAGQAGQRAADGRRFGRGRRLGSLVFAGGLRRAGTRANRHGQKQAGNRDELRPSPTA